MASAHLGGDVVWGATEGLGCHPVPDVFLTHAKISDLDVALGIQHHIVKFQVTVGDTDLGTELNAISFESTNIHSLCAEHGTMPGGGTAVSTTQSSPSSSL